MDALAHTGFRFVTMAVTYVGMAMLAGAIIDNVDWLTNARDSMNSGEDPWGIAVLVRMAIGIIGTIGGLIVGWMFSEGFVDWYDEKSEQSIVLSAFGAFFGIVCIIVMFVFAVAALLFVAAFMALLHFAFGVLLLGLFSSR